MEKYLNANIGNMDFYFLNETHFALIKPSSYFFQSLKKYAKKLGEITAAATKRHAAPSYFAIPTPQRIILAIIVQKQPTC